MKLITPIVLTIMLVVAAARSAEWYDKATKATIDANQQLDAAMKQALNDWNTLQRTKGSIKTRTDLLALIGKMKVLVRTLDGRISAAEKRHIQSKRHLRTSLLADEIKSGSPLHKTMTNRFSQMDTRVAGAKQIVNTIAGEIAQTEKKAREINPASKGLLDKAIAAYKKARTTVTAAVQQAEQIVEGLRQSGAAIRNEAQFNALVDRMNKMTAALEASVTSARQDNAAARKHLKDAVYSGEVENGGEVHRTLLNSLDQQSQKLTAMARDLGNLRAQIGRIIETAKQLHAANAESLYGKIFKQYQAVQAIIARTIPTLQKAIADANTTKRDAAYAEAASPVVTRLTTENNQIKSVIDSAMTLNRQAGARLLQARNAREIEPAAIRSLFALLDPQQSQIRQLRDSSGKLAASINDLSKRPPKPPAPSQVAADLIKKHTKDGKLDKEAMAKDLLTQLPAKADAVSEILNALDRGDRDNVAFALLTNASNAQLNNMKKSPAGKKILALMAAELSDGWDTASEKKQIARLFANADSDAPKGTYSKSKDSARKYAGDAKSDAADGLISKHSTGPLLDEKDLGAALLKNVGKDDALVGKVLDNLGFLDRDDVSYAALANATDTEIMTLAKSKSGRESMLRMVHEISKGDMADSERKEMQRTMALITRVERANSSTPPKVEVLTFMTGSAVTDFLGQAFGSQGHTAIAVGDMVYSFEGGGWGVGITKEQYLRENNHRNAIGQELNIPRADVKIIQDALNKSAGTGVYGLGGNICTDSTANKLNLALRNLPQSWSPPDFVSYLDDTGKVGGYKFYPSNRSEN